MRLLRTLAAAAALWSFPAVAFADGLQVEPGLWEFVSSIPDPLSGEPLKQVHRSCVRDRTITPARVMAQIKECRIWNASFKGALVHWKMRCETPAGPMVGNGKLRSIGTSVLGALEMTMALGALEIPVNGTFKGRRIGACR